MAGVSSNTRRVAIVAGVRTPFVKAGAALAPVSVTDLARTVFQETLHRAHWTGDHLDEVILGNVANPADAVNPARVAAIQAGIPRHVPALTVQRNCASGMEALGLAADRIAHGRSRAVLAGGAESMSNIPLLFPPEMLLPAARLMRARTPWQKLTAIASLRPRHFKPQIALEMGLTDPTCGMIMGRTAEVLAREFGIERAEQDDFALKSHLRAAAAMADGRFARQTVPVYAGERFKPVATDVGPRAQQSLAALAKLKPFFDRRDGTITVGNACQITDGAVSLLLMDDELARTEGYPPLGYIRGYAVAALDPARMGLGPVFAMDRLLRQVGAELNDVGLFEINEAFAAQVLACLNAMASDSFAREHLNRDKALGTVDPDKLNVSGGAIALGHPVGASGARLVLNLLHEMAARDVQTGIATLCVGGGQGAAMFLERA